MAKFIFMNMQLLYLKEMEQTEFWIDVEGYEGLYEVSNFGRVKSLDRKSSDGRQLKERMLKPIINGYGYLVLNLYKNGKRKSLYIHQLVAMAFLEHTPNGHKIVVDHIDNDKSNNRLENLQLISNRQNTSKDRKGYSSKYVGVAWYEAKSKWISQIMINGKLKYLGLFTNELEAAEAYQSKLNEISI